LVRTLGFLEDTFRRWGVAKSLFVGFALGLALSLPVFAVSIEARPAAFAVGFFLYFPFHAWLTVSLFQVLFSTFERKRLVGPDRSAPGAFFARLFSPYCLFCIGWFYALMAAGVLSGAID
jgi:hypothetical protein